MLETSGLIAGKDFYISFAPERTVEGDALNELRSLPQVIGSYDKQSLELTRSLFLKITNSIVEVDSLEAAEMIKLINNTYRDLVFSFSNEVSLICDELNINSHSLIACANEGYTRNPVPLPSPGVGGICLTKDPFLYTNHFKQQNKYKPCLGTTSRTVNDLAYRSIYNKVEYFARRLNKTPDQLDILVIGMAFRNS